MADSYRHVFSIRKGPWKLIQSHGGGGIREEPDRVDPAQPPGQLFHLNRDIEERHNVYTQHPEKVAELSDLLREVRDGYQTSKGDAALKETIPDGVTPHRDQRAVVQSLATRVSRCDAT